MPASYRGEGAVGAAAAGPAGTSAATTARTAAAATSLVIPDRIMPSSSSERTSTRLEKASVRSPLNGVKAAVAAAHEAFPNWAALSPKDRAAVLHAVGEGIEKRALELAAVETRDNGSLLRSMQRSVMPRAGHNFHFFADELVALAHED